MNKEEKEAIERLDYFEPDDLVECAMYRDCVEKIKKLIDKQQKEIKELKSQLDFIDEQNRHIDKMEKAIEELKEKKKTLETLLQGNLYEMYLYYKELASRYQANSVSKDKIRELIKDINEETQYIGKDRGETKQHYAVEKILGLLGE